MNEYKIRMIEEYRALKERYEKLHKMIVKFEAGTLEFEPTCPIALLKEQAATMGNYLRILEVRAEIEKIGYDMLTNRYILYRDVKKETPVNLRNDG